MIRLVEVRKKD